MQPSVENLEKLYSDTATCAKLVGLHYVQDDSLGLTRKKRGKGFTYSDLQNKTVSDSIKRRIESLVIPPAWQEVWICPKPEGHVLATGIDERGRKQYMYHPKWRTMRDLIKFYRMISFGRTLPTVRRAINEGLAESSLTRTKILAVMLWILDNAYIRVGNGVYFEQNESVGLTTLTGKNITIAGPVVSLSFVGKSGKDQQISFEHAEIAELLATLNKQKGARLFRYTQPDGTMRDVEASDVNNHIHEISGASVSAKDFRTWGGTLMAFNHLIESTKADTNKKAEKVVIEAIDQAAAVLGNTRAISRSSYVHPHILAAYTADDFRDYYEAAHGQRKLTGLDKQESDLLHVLEQLFEKEFTLLK